MNRQNKKENISLLLIVKNEEENLKNNFKWLDMCPRINEIVAVENDSTDNTVEVLKNLKNKYRHIKICSKDIREGFSVKRTFGLQQTSNDWVLWLDADEQPSKEMIDFINDIDLYQCDSAFSFKRNDVFLGRELKYGETANSRFVRLFNKTKGAFKGMVHEVWKSNQNEIKTNFSIIHESHKTFYSLISKINFYTDLRARELYERRVKTSIFQIIFYPAAKFFQNYIIRLGILDSTAGAVMAISMSFHSFLVRSKLWHYWQK